MTDKSKYELFCKKYENILPIYLQYWWLDIVCKNKQWNVLLYENKDKVEAVMPFYSPCKGVLSMPQYCQCLGIWFAPDFQLENTNKEIYRKQKISLFFISQLPKHKVFYQKFSSQYQDYLPFYWNNYKQTTFYNYVLENIKDTNKLYENFRSNIKRNIKDAIEKDKLTITTNISIDNFLSLREDNFKRKNAKMSSRETLKTLIEKSISRNQGRIYASIDAESRIHDAIFLVWSGNNAYYITGGRNQEFIKSSNMAYLFFSAIKELSAIVDNFDFEGSMDRGIGHFFLGFSPIQKQYFYIYKGKISFWDKLKIHFNL